LFEYVCEHLVPGCHHKDRDESRDALLERVAIHLREHHDLDHRDTRTSEALKRTGITYIRPA
jgi:predicted small metal-binding protein